MKPFPIFPVLIDRDTRACFPERRGSAIEEQTLIEALKKHRRRALHQVIDTYTGYVTTVACRTAGGSVSHEDLEEIVSDVFLALWLHADTLDSAKPLRPYLAAIARSKAVDCLRRTRNTLSLEETPLPATVPGPEETAEQRETQDLLERAVRSLPEPEQTLCRRYYFEGQPLKEIAAAFQWKESTAKTRLRRTRLRLKELLKEGGIDHA